MPNKDPRTARYDASTARAKRYLTMLDNLSYGDKVSKIKRLLDDYDKLQSRAFHDSWAETARQQERSGGTL